MRCLEKGFEICRLADFSKCETSLLFTEEISRKEMIQFLDAATKGGHHLDFPHVSHLKTEGFELKPLKASGRRIKNHGLWGWLFSSGTIVHDVCIDGEVVQLSDGDTLLVKTLPESDQIFYV
jgi:hypothetical protein